MADQTMTDQTAAAEATLQPAAGRSCGTCTMCCKVLQIADLGKPAGIWCKHVKPGSGCTVYADRPLPCRQYFCEWMLDSRFGPEWKPDTAKFAVNPLLSDSNLLIAVDPNFPNAWRKEPYISQIRQWVKDCEAMGRFVMVRIGARCIALLPDGERELGAVGIDDDIFVSRSAGPSGYVYSVEVRRAAN